LALKRSEAEEKSVKEINKSANLERELCERSKLHDSFVVVKEEQHQKELDEIRQDAEIKISKLKSQISQLNLKIDSKEQQAKMNYIRKRSQDRHESNIEIMRLKEAVATSEIRIATFEKNSAQQEEVKSELEGQISKLEKFLKEKDSQICASRTVIEENRLINSEYSAQVDKQFQEMQKHFENSEFELKNKINLLEKQLRIRRAQLSQIKEESRSRLKLSDKIPCPTRHPKIFILLYA